LEQNGLLSCRSREDTEVQADTPSDHNAKKGVIRRTDEKRGQRAERLTDYHVDARPSEVP